ncbi:MAG: response regulator [Planctomycetota bacterium]|jgi:CheY-like chemotaxis protein
MTGKKKILVVDDEEKLTKMVKRNLELTGKFDVRMENNGADALAAARDFRPDLILLDVMMPGTDGGEVASQIQDDSDLESTPIVFLTAIVTKEEVEESGGTISGRPFIAKPVQADELIKVIEDNLPG